MEYSSISAKRVGAAAKAAGTTSEGSRSLNAAEDRKLIRRCLEEDRQAYRLLLARYQDPVYNYCWRMLKNPGLAEEVAQESFVRTLTRLDRYDEKYPFSAWLFKIATNLCIDHIRKNKRIAYSLDEDLQGEDGSFRREVASNTPDPSQVTFQNERREIIAEAIAELPEHYRSILLLRHQAEKSYQEISEILDLPLGTVKIRIHRAREQLKRRLKRDEIVS